VALASFFDRIYSALGGHLSVSCDDLATSLQGVVVGIKCGAGLSQNDLWIAELATNLLARLYPRLAITGPEKHVSRLKDIALAINPEIEIVGKAPSGLTIAIGEVKSGAELWPAASGWVARLNHSRYPGSGPSNPYAAGAATAFATAELFRRIFLGRSPERDFKISLLNFNQSSGADQELPSSTVGDVLFVAVGAIGNAALWALARDRRRSGQVTLIDHENLELSNLQRYVLGTLQDVTKQREKVFIGRRELIGTQISAETFRATLESFADERDGISTPTVCISVDNVAARRAAQALLPRLIINGWTGDQALGASWHVFSREAACLACLYQPHGPGISQTEQAARALGLAPERAALLWVTRLPLSDDDIATAANKLGVSPEALAPWRGKSLGDLYTDVVCGAVPISLPVANRVETVPLAHQSALAGILMAAELVKRTNPQLASKSQAEPLVSWEDVLRPPPAIWAKPRAREKGCICGDRDYQTIFGTKWRTLS
jgi:Prokaryotic E2 family C/ThiF family